MTGFKLLAPAAFTIAGIYGRLEIEVERQEETWVAYRKNPGIRRRLDDLAYPPS